MRPLLRPVWRILRTSKAAKLILLALVPAFAQPLDYLQKPAPFHAKIRGLWWLPMLPAAIWANANASMLEWIAWQQAKTAALGHSASELILKMHDMLPLMSKGAFVLMAALTYSFAILRWLYHFFLALIFKRFNSPVIPPPLKFFVVNSAAWAFWFAAFGNLCAYALWRSDGDIRGYLERLISDHQYVFLLTMVAVGLALKFCGKVQHRGMLQVYGGSKAAMAMVDSVAIAISILMLFFVSHYR